ncbi:MAG: MopE-related protein [Flavobacteriales bacterium]
MRQLLLLLALGFSTLLTAQAPQAFDFQGVARNASGQVLSDQAIALRISILSGGPSGTVAYQETHNVTTSPFGLFSIAIGIGTPTQGSFQAIGWGASSHFIQVEMNATGAGFVDMGTTQLLSVPYALHARAVDCFTVSLLGDTLKQGNGCYVIIPGVSAANGGCVDADGDGYYNIPGCGPVDCIDTNPNVHPNGMELCGDGLDNDCDGQVDNSADPLAGVLWYQDADGDGYGVEGVTLAACAQPAGYVLTMGDCDDADPLVFPGQGCSQQCTPAEANWIAQHQAEYFEAIIIAAFQCGASTGLVDWVCVQEELSNDGVPIGLSCNSCYQDLFVCYFFQGCTDMSCWVSSGCLGQWADCVGFLDADGDGWAAASDCNDANATVWPGAPEVACDGLDNGCDGSADLIATWYADLDGDGYGDPATAQQTCTAPPGAVQVGGDCDDANNDISPAADEACDGIDNNCDGQVDEDVTINWYPDQDGDGFGVFAGVVTSCPETPPGPGYVTNANDCDDSNEAVYLGADDPCTGGDGIDNDCNGAIDDQDAPVWYRDADEDGWGTDQDQQQTCVQPSGYVSQVGDCDDGNGTVFPGAAELCDGLDNDCDGESDESIGTLWYPDVDEDGFGDASAGGWLACSPPDPSYVGNNGDCDDLDPNTRPGADDLCAGGDGIDNDCNGAVDDQDAPVWYRDVDGDGWGTDQDQQQTCQQPVGYVGQAGDCDDSNDAVRPGAPDPCTGGDGLDNDCNGAIDEQGAPVWSRDLDGDGWGTDLVQQPTCQQPVGYVGQAGDCDDGNDAIFPGATEVCDGLDNDCDGQQDEGIDLLTDPANCGDCGIVCPPGFTCQEGECVPE